MHAWEGFRIPNIQVPLGKGGWRLGGLTFSPSALPLSARSCELLPFHPSPLKTNVNELFLG